MAMAAMPTASSKYRFIISSPFLAERQNVRRPKDQGQAQPRRVREKTGISILVSSRIVPPLEPPGVHYEETLILAKPLAA
jgi:hypothetical protein